MKKQLFFILLLSFALRFYGLNWDQGQHLHPDERFLTMVGTTIKWPQTIREYFKTSSSPLNPYNKGFGFFVYGPLPLFLTKLLAGFGGWANYANFHLVGRVLSLVADLGVVLLLSRVFEGTTLWASFIYGSMVLPIQLSHFFTTDTFLNLFILLSFYSVTNFPVVFTGIFFGLALASKINAVLFLPIIFLLLLKKFKTDWKRLLSSTFFFFLVAFITFRITSPYSFSGLIKINPQFIANLKELKSWEGPDVWFPPAVQWIKTKPLLFPLFNLLVWGLGLPLAGLTLVSFVFGFLKFLKSIRQKKLFNILETENIILLWICFFLVFQGFQFVKTMRYFLLIYPFIALMVGQFLSEYLREKWQKIFLAILLLFYPLAFINIYSSKHTRVQASEWIYENIPSGSTISCDHWDDCLPLNLEGNSSQEYQTEMLHFWDAETEEKWNLLREQVERLDYLIISSSRVYGPISNFPERYPQTTQFYRDLFEGKLGFKKVAQFTSYPRLLGIVLNDDSSEEAFTVYDHPKVMIFKKE